MTKDTLASFVLIVMKGLRTTDFFSLSRVCGAMDNASAYGAEDSRFDPWQTRLMFFVFFPFLYAIHPDALTLFMRI